ncbi:FAD-binding oxidoreductase [beta proteobacterium MWH-UniP1]
MTAAPQTTATTTISGWGGYPTQEAQVIIPRSLSGCKTELERHSSLIARGMGRSYGDSANAATVLQTTCCDHFIAFDDKTGLLTAEAGVTLRDILKITVKHGWFLPVTPGTSYVTVGGAIASDVHGKNHHVAGTFGQHVVSLTLLLGTGEIVTASPTHLQDLFHATCGGMGLTGVILVATIQLIPVKSAQITQKTIKAASLEEACEAFEVYSASTYSVAWIDCLATGKRLGRSVVMLGEHSDSGGLNLTVKDPVTVPIHTPAALLNSMTMRAFNIAYWAKAAHDKTQTVPLQPYFYPLDALGGWNKLYGKAGFVQYQFVLPKADGVSNMRTILTQIAESGAGSFLAVLKQFGPANKNLLSFPIEGYTLALDFKMSSSVVALLHRLDDMVAGMGGRVYLTKDAVMKELTFKATYPEWQEFEAVRHKYGALGKFASAQSKRLGLA